jgi:ABC-type nitrate/sulfonate/bicarbonate transport system substrate-binding protein
MKDIWKRSMLAAVVVLLLAPAAFAAGPPEQPNVDVYVIRDAQMSAQWGVAQARGLFKEFGLDPKIHWVLAAPDIPNMVSAGQVHVFGATYPVIQSLRAKNIEVYWVAPLAMHAGTQQFLLGPKTQVNSPKDLEKLKIGMTTGVTPAIMVRNFSKEYGVDFSKLNFVNMQAPEKVTALIKGDIDAAVLWEPWATQAKKQGARVYFNGTQSNVPGSEGPRTWFITHTGVGITKSFAEKNPNTVVAILKGLYKATDELNRDIPGSAKVLAEVMRIPEDVLSASMPMNKYTMVIDQRGVDAANEQRDFYIEIRRLEKKLPSEDMFYTKFLEEVSPSLVQWKSGPMK